MKYRILNLGLSANHEQIVATLANVNEALSISDHDAFVFDPAKVAGTQIPKDVFERRQREIRDLALQKAGVVICVLRQYHTLVVPNLGESSAYTLLAQAAPQPAEFIRTRIRSGQGRQLKVCQQARALAGNYLRVLQGKLFFDAFLDTTEKEVTEAGGTVAALNSVGRPVALEFPVNAGRICFVPVPADVPGERVGAAIMRIVETHFGGPSEIELPAWASGVTVPGADANDGKIAELEKRREEVEAEISVLAQKRAELMGYRALLFGYGKTVLERTVRLALRQLGFEVPEPEQYEGEWDVELKEPVSGKTAIGEVEGSEGPIDQEKFRQLLHYITDEILAAREHKGLLIGNGYRLKDLDAPERLSQFTAHALRGGTHNKYCLLPTSELFKAVCSVLAAPEDEALKLEIRRSILDTVGPWIFAGKAGLPKSSDSSGETGAEAASNC